VNDEMSNKLFVSRDSTEPTTDLFFEMTFEPRDAYFMTPMDERNAHTFLKKTKQKKRCIELNSTSFGAHSGFTAFNRMRAGRNLLSWRMPWQPQAGGQVGLLGLFPVPFVQQADATITKCQQISAKATTTTASVNTLVEIDNISNEICRVTDALELIRNVHPDPEVMQCAMETHHRLAEFIFNLNSNPALYKIVSESVVAIDGDPSVSDELRLMGHHMHGEFERAGIHLAPEHRATLQALQSKELSLCTQFSQNIATENSFCCLPAGSINSLPSNISHAVASQTVPMASINSYEQDALFRRWSAAMNSSSLFPSERHNVSRQNTAIVRTSSYLHNLLISNAHDPKIRQHIYSSFHLAASKNIPVLQDLLRTRAELAKMVGSSSHAHSVLQQSMAKSVPVVENFLDDLSKMVHDRAHLELNNVCSAIREAEGDTMRCREGVTYPWDSYYQNMLRSKCETPIANYLSVVSSSILNFFLFISFAFQFVAMKLLNYRAFS
jgi:Zn-dependent oligopeptidase